MDDMTYYEKIEALSGTIFDYDDVIDNTTAYLITMAHVTMRNGVAGMIRGMMECIVIPTDWMLLMVRLSFPGLGWLLSHTVLWLHRN